MTAPDLSLEQLTFFAEASPASPGPLPASKPERGTLVISGRKCFDWHWCFGRAGSWWRTLAASSAWHSTRCGLTWKVRVTPLGRPYCQLAVSMPRTAGIASGLWLPTPTGMDAGGTLQATANTTQWGGVNSLTGMAKLNKWPDGMLHTATSTANQGSPLMAERDAGSWFLTKDNLLSTPCADDTGLRTERYQQGATALSMQVAAMEGMLPTPAASDHKGSSQEGQRRGQLSEVVTGTKLNPDWVSRMQGFPDDWLNLPTPDGTATP
jgi:hypothetical protein